MERLRYGLIDTLRGAAILGVVVYHFIYDLIHFYSIAIPWFYSTPVYVIQQAGAWLFIFISGAMTLCANNPARNGLILVSCGLMSSVVTYFVSPAYLIVFGILSLLGWAALITLPLRPLLRKIPNTWGALLCLLLFLFTHDVANGKIGFLGHEFFDLPASWYGSSFLFFLGFPNDKFVSADYFPFLPWLFPFWQGYFCWQLADEDFRRKYLCWQIPSFSFLGRHSLLIHLLHQPFILVISGFVFGD